MTFIPLFNQKEKEKTKTNPPVQSRSLLKLNQCPQILDGDPCPRHLLWRHPPCNCTGDCLRHLLVLCISVHLSCLNSYSTNLAQCIKIPIENNENLVST